MRVPTPAFSEHKRASGAHSECCCFLLCSGLRASSQADSSFFGELVSSYRFVWPRALNRLHPRGSKALSPPPTSPPACLLWQAQQKWVKADMTSCYECDNIKLLLKKSIKCCWRPACPGIAFRHRGAILPGATGPLLLSQRELITAEATESKHAMPQTHTAAF